jgi:N-acetylmuramic acid 6-phosphate etherase
VETPRLLLLSRSSEHPDGLANGSGLVGRYFTEHLFAGAGGRLDEPSRQNHVGFNTLFVTTVPRDELDVDPDVAICPVVGPEVIMGSTRMKSGTAQKLVLNMITTAAMVRMGKVYENMMVDLQRTSEKLVERGIRTVMMVTGVDYEEADAVLDTCDGHVKTAIVMILADVDLTEARRRLEETDGFVRPAIEKAE